METIKKLLKITIVLCLVALVIIPVVALSNKPGEKSGLTLKEAKEKMTEIANSDYTITDEEEIYLQNIFDDFNNNIFIDNLYYYCYARYYYYKYDYYGSVKSMNDANKKNKYLEKAKEEIKNINTNYTGEFSDEISWLIDDIEEAEPVKYQNPSNSKPSSNNSGSNSSSNSNGHSSAYNALTSKDKANIRKYIQSRYDYYDKLYGYYTGDKYSDSIWKEVARKYGITESEVTIIWANLD